MINEVTLLVDRWLRHEDYGVEAMLETVPRLRPDGKADPRPKIPKIYNDVEHGLEVDPPSSPALVVFAFSEPTTDLRDLFHQKYEQVMVSVAYATRDVEQTQATRDGNYVLRAVRKSLVRFNDQRLSSGYRELNSIKIQAGDRATIRRVAGSVGSSQLWGFVLASLKVVDNDI